QRIFGEDFLPARSFSPTRKTIETFQETDELWEVLRFKWKSKDSLDKKWAELKLSQYSLNYLLWGPPMKRPLQLHFHTKKVCPHCDFESHPVATVSAFSPYTALGACPACSGYGANLVY